MLFVEVSAHPETVCGKVYLESGFVLSKCGKPLSILRVPHTLSSNSNQDFTHPSAGIVASNAETCLFAAAFSTSSELTEKGGMVLEVWLEVILAELRRKTFLHPAKLKLYHMASAKPFSVMVTRKLGLKNSDLHLNYLNYLTAPAALASLIPNASPPIK